MRIFPDTVLLFIRFECHTVRVWRCQPACLSADGAFVPYMDGLDPATLSKQQMYKYVLRWLLALGELLEKYDIDTVVDFGGGVGDLLG